MPVKCQKTSENLDFPYSVNRPMRSAFSTCGRVAFARGNSHWARTFNQSLQSSRKFVTGSACSIAPSTWRMLSASSSLTLNKVAVAFAAAETPARNGFAEQRGCAEACFNSLTSPPSDEATESSDELAEALSTAPAWSHVSLIKSLSDVIVFGSNWCNEMGKDYRLCGH